MLVPCVIVLMVLDVGFGELRSPCPDVFQYESRQEQRRWFGRIHLRSDDELIGIWIHVEMDREIELLGNWFGDSTTYDNIKFTIKNHDYVLEPGITKTIRIFAQYYEGPTPNLVSVRLNGKTICSRGKRSSGKRTTIYISHKPVTEPTLATQHHRHTTLASVSTESFWTEQSPAPLAGPVPTPPVVRQEEYCGRVAKRPVELILHGQNTTQGQWPWHAALYYSGGLQLIYTCGGTLVSSRHVVTAAHCVTMISTNETINVDKLVIYLGKHNLNSFGTNVQSIDAESIHLHPEYDPGTFYNDIAVVTLSRSAQYTKNVRPVCLWSSDTSLSSVVNKVGTVVGWGFDDKKHVSEYLMQAAMPVVPLETCIFSNRDFFSRLLFDKNYCAGFRNGTSVCNGDSGGGMVFPRTGTRGVDTVWELRGIVSIGVAQQTEMICDPDHFIIFTDVAKHLRWVKNIMGRR
ncbi:CLIP domain-containing serine protease B15 [Aethina tumida]|uniref:CLIP domain-containing serine protease B15 n=1 Tax=Aethina tumida TaxID=116153 RepID=UPI0021472AE2|nr:CLIP domain-containing serine protease B15 [Aethina tumida]XP_049824759.1 CLIP domain-containing serine protease B15 [Aethina tumida]